MKRSVAAALGALALVASLPASAADLPARGMPYKAPASAPMYNWTGFYLGINGGGAFGNSDWNGLGVSNSPGGGMIGVTAGYNWQGMGSPWVFGIEGDVDASFVSDSTRLRRLPPARPRTNGSARCAAASAMPGIAGCRM